MSHNRLCGLYKDVCGDIQGTYTADGITKLCEGLKGSAVTSLECAAASLLCQRPLTQLLSLTILAPPLTRSLGENNIGFKGASALAAVLKETKITTLGCAATRQCSPFCQRR